VTLTGTWYVNGDQNKRAEIVSASSGLQARNENGDSSAVSQKFVELVFGLLCVIPAEGRYPDVFEFPGFRVALAIASLPGMTFELYCELQCQELTANR